MDAASSLCGESSPPCSRATNSRKSRHHWPARWVNCPKPTTANEKSVHSPRGTVLQLLAGFLGPRRRFLGVDQLACARRHTASRPFRAVAAERDGRHQVRDLRADAGQRHGPLRAARLRQSGRARRWSPSRCSKLSSCNSCKKREPSSSPARARQRRPRLRRAALEPRALRPARRRLGTAPREARPAPISAFGTRPLHEERKSSTDARDWAR